MMMNVDVYYIGGNDVLPDESKSLKLTLAINIVWKLWLLTRMKQCLCCIDDDTKLY